MPMPKFARPFRLTLAALPLGLFAGAHNLSLAAPSVELTGPETTCSMTLGQLQALHAQPLETDLEILSWNIQKADNAGWAKDLAEFGHGVDLAFLQEASLQADIESVLPQASYSSFARGYMTSTLDTGVMTLSSGLPSLRCQLSAQEPWLGTPKATSVTEYALRGREDRLLAINLHAVNFTFGVEEFRAQFHALTDLLVKHQGPVILAGDLNTWSESRETVVREFLQHHGLAPVTFSDDQRTRAFGRALDHIYVRGMQSRYARVIPVNSSDHNPLRVGLSIE
jgi:endonuclease/exonuclease/phosphatase (EEP) superfamily protein YafD